MEEKKNTVYPLPPPTKLSHTLSSLPFLQCLPWLHPTISGRSNIDTC